MPKFDLTTAKPREVESYLRSQVLRLFGNEIEDKTRITASRGYYSLELPFLAQGAVLFENFRKKEVPQILKALKALKG